MSIYSTNFKISKIKIFLLKNNFFLFLDLKIFKATINYRIQNTQTKEIIRKSILKRSYLFLIHHNFLVTSNQIPFLLEKFNFSYLLIFNFKIYSFIQINAFTFSNYTINNLLLHQSLTIGLKKLFFKDLKVKY